MKLAFRQTARSDLARIFAYLDQESPQARRNVEQRLRDALDNLLVFPFTGMETTRAGVRRLAVTPYSYAIFYRVSPDTLTVLSIRHTARRPTRMLGS